VVFILFEDGEGLGLMLFLDNLTTYKGLQRFIKKFIFGNMITPQQEHIIKTVTQRFKPKMLGVFGSYARGEQNEKSDLDILIDFDIKIDLLELIGLEQELSELLGIKVDLITLRSVNALLKPYIESDLVRLL
jgi:predicted nucleotidyltransferase